MEERPDCYKCSHRRKVPGSGHSRCNNHEAKVEGHPQGIAHGWFIWPFNFDPTWLVSCNGFSISEDDKNAPLKQGDPFAELAAMLK